MLRGALSSKRCKLEHLLKAFVLCEVIKGLKARQIGVKRVRTKSSQLFFSIKSYEKMLCSKKKGNSDNTREIVP